MILGNFPEMYLDYVDHLQAEHQNKILKYKSKEEVKAQNKGLVSKSEMTKN